ncbi:DrmB family protein [Glutamicibacter ardleyensis]|uniref:DrmB family protein n=1 Tax=Glutamicibacter ardleyensis TaxID=225894 RepID=UPI003FD3183E
MSNNNQMRQIRHGETVYPYGPGAIVDILGESFVAPDITHWDRKTLKPMSCPRLERELGVPSLKTAPSGASFDDAVKSPLTFNRFPKWRFCQNCGLMSNKMQVKNGITYNCCRVCDGKMVPMRYVASCSAGSHLQDVPWRNWVHVKAASVEQRLCQDADNMVFSTEQGVDESLGAVFVTCRSCKTRRSLMELNAEKSLHRDGFKCYGTQPWEGFNKDSICTEELHAVQRGSTSLYRPEIVSAIDIPEVDSPTLDLMDKVREHPTFTPLKALVESETAMVLADMIAKDLTDRGYVIDSNRVLSIAKDPSGTEETLQVMTNLLSGEWSAFEKSLSADPGSQIADFDVKRIEFEQGDESLSSLSSLSKRVSAVGAARRLREVRVVRGFTRFKPEAKMLRVDLNKERQLNWYPAVEQFGEGVFIRFDETSMREWEQQRGVINRVDNMVKRLLGTYRAQDASKISARWMMLHSFAHLLIRNFESQSGYPAASIRERIYASPEGLDPQCGILIYTSAGDREGTLGGLVRLAEPAYLSRILLRAIEASDTCSNDPVCGESNGQGLFGLNLSGCHGCLLTAETSCENGNVYLDRRLLTNIDSPNESLTGFFDDVLIQARGML